MLYDSKLCSYTGMFLIFSVVHHLNNIIQKVLIDIYVFFLCFIEHKSKVYLFITSPEEVQSEEVFERILAKI